MVANRGITTFINTLYTAYSGGGASGAGAGFNTALYKAGYGNIIYSANGASSNNPALGAQGIMDATKILAGQRDSSGQPIMLGGMGARVKIVYGSSNVATAKNLHGAAETSFIKKCEKDSAASSAADSCKAKAADKNLHGAAQTSFVNKCVKDSAK
jgi:hypothetical protein